MSGTWGRLAAKPGKRRWMHLYTETSSREPSPRSRKKQTESMSGCSRTRIARTPVPSCTRDHMHGSSVSRTCMHVMQPPHGACMGLLFSGVCMHISCCRRSAHAWLLRQQGGHACHATAAIAHAAACMHACWQAWHGSLLRGNSSMQEVLCRQAQGQCPLLTFLSGSGWPFLMSSSTLWNSYCAAAMRSPLDIACS